MTGSTEWARYMIPMPVIKPPAARLVCTSVKNMQRGARRIVGNTKPERPKEASREEACATPEISENSGSRAWPGGDGTDLTRSFHVDIDQELRESQSTAATPVGFVPWSHRWWHLSP